MNVGNFNTIPAELRQLKQWICCKTDKNLFQVNGNQASTDKPDTWNTFEACLAAIGKHNLISVGLVLTINDPYFIIDLDKTSSEERRGPVHQSIHDDFDTYSEISQSGNGCHIVGKGSLNGIGGFKNKEWGVECYSSGRYIMFTGKIYNQKPIADRQDLLNKLQQAFRPAIEPAAIIITPTTLTDEEIIAKICAADNGETFRSFYHDGYPESSDRSSVDMAFMNFMAFYSVGAEQAIRLIKASALGKQRANGPKDKSKKFGRKDYLINTYNDAVSKPLQQVAPIDIGDYRNALEKKLRSSEQEQVASVPSAITIPPGLVGKIARYAYDASPTPVAEIALASALALMAGICGRSHSISGTGLNLYLMMLAPSGTGKESGGKSITTLLSAVKQQAPNANFIGPGEIVSGPALYKAMAANPCYLSILGEFGLTIQEMSSKNASSAQVSLRKMLLQIFNKSGPNDVLHPIVYSDRANNTLPVESPALSLLCDSAPEIFYDNLDESMIVGGLIPRFVFFEYTEFDPPYNRNHHEVKPSNDLLQELTVLSLQALSMATTEFNKNDLKNVRRTIDVPITEEASAILENFRVHVKAMMGNKELTRNLWNRAHVNAWKIAALVAIGENVLFPMISADNIVWACKLVESSVTNLAKKFASGEVGRNSSEIKQELQVIRIIKEYLRSSYDKVKTYSVKSEKMHYDKVIPFSYISQRLGTMPLFQNDKIGKTNAIKRTLKNMVEEDKLRELERPYIVLTYHARMQCFVIHDLDVQ